MRVLYLHPGYEKTGSTVIQDALLLMRPTLQAHGLDFPVLGAGPGLGLPQDLGQGMPQGPPEGLPVSGNAGLVFAHPARRRALFEAASPRARRGAIWSNEVLLLEHDARGRNLAELVDDALARGFDAVRILLFVRDPVPHAASLWQQYLRNERRMDQPLDAWLADRYDHPRLVADFLEAAAALPPETCRVEVHNHSRLAAPLLEIVRRWLDLPEAARPAQTDSVRANLSMTASQARLLLALNRQGAAGAMSSDLGLRLRALDARGDPRKPAPSPAAVAAMLARIEPDLARAEALMPPAARYDRAALPAREAAEGDAARFLPPELGALAEEVGRLQLRLDAAERDARRWRRLRACVPAPLRGAASAALHAARSLRRRAARTP
ncbi:MAG: hypothetical protein AAGI51_01210 [Pseudomonadota bacterium]